jgi:hypothetical protein
VPTAYEIAAASTGELRLYLNTAGPLMLQELRAALGYGFAYEPDRRTAADPWEYAFGDARHVESEAVFQAERDRIIDILRSLAPDGWEADLLYHPPRQSSALYQWSTTVDD